MYIVDLIYFVFNLFYTHCCYYDCYYRRHRAHTSTLPPLFTSLRINFRKLCLGLNFQMPLLLFYNFRVHYANKTGKQTLANKSPAVSIVLMLGSCRNEQRDGVWKSCMETSHVLIHNENMALALLILTTRKQECRLTSFKWLVYI